MSCYWLVAQEDGRAVLLQVPYKYRKKAVATAHIATGDRVSQEGMVLFARQWHRIYADYVTVNHGNRLYIEHQGEQIRVLTNYPGA